jgi:hypothetical protein
MKTRGHFIPLSLCGALIVGCRSDSDRVLPPLAQPVFDATAASQPVGPVTIQTVLDFSTLRSTERSLSSRARQRQVLWRDLCRSLR